MTSRDDLMKEIADAELELIRASRTLTQDQIFERKLFIKVAAHQNTNDAENAVKVYRRLFGDTHKDTNIVDSVCNTHEDDHASDFKLQWDTAPEWAKWAAMDANGEWNWWEKRPRNDAEIFDDEWLVIDGRMGDVEQFDNPPFPGDWKDSLQWGP